jgi:hypothetical protein
MEPDLAAEKTEAGGTRKVSQLQDPASFHRTPWSSLIATDTSKKLSKRLLVLRRENVIYTLSLLISSNTLL